MLLGNSSHLHYKIQHELLSDPVAALINLRAEAELLGEKESCTI